MPIQLTEENGGKVLVIRVAGKLTAENYASFVPEFERLVRQHGKLNVLFDMTLFHGWEAAALWEDIKFNFKHFSDIARLAMVGDKKWEHGMAAFCGPFTKATIRFFHHDQIRDARKWLKEPSVAPAKPIHEPAGR